jgi:hypothetical protein
MRTISSALLLLGLLAGARGADREAAPPASGVIPSDTAGFVHVDVSALGGKESLKALLEHLVAVSSGQALDDYSRGAFGVEFAQLDAVAFLFGEKFNVIAVRLRKAPEREALLKSLFPGATEQTYKGKKYYATLPLEEPGKPAVGVGMAFYFPDAQTYVSGQTKDVRHFIDLSAKPDEEVPLHAMYARAREHHLTVGLAPSVAELKEAKEGLRQDARRDPMYALVYYALRPLGEARRFLLTVDAGEETQAEVTLGFANADDAGKAPEAVRVGLALLAGGLDFLQEELSDTLAEEGKEASAKLRELAGRLRAALKDAHVTRDGRQVRVTAKAKTDEALVKAVLGETLPRVKLAAAQATSANNLKQLALAVHNYHDTMGAMPPAWGTMPPSPMFDARKKPQGLSWRVYLLPYVEEQALYQQFKLDEPWDSEHNKKLIPLMPKIFAPVGRVQTKEKGMTFYQAVTTSNTDMYQSVFPISREGMAPKITLVGIPDGTSNTLMFVEAAEPVLWTKPDDVFFDSSKDKLLPKLGGLFKDGFHAAHCDGSVRFYRKKDVTEKFLKAFVGRQDGEVIEFPGDRRERGGAGAKDVPQSVPQKAPDRKSDPPPDRK